MATVSIAALQQVLGLQQNSLQRSDMERVSWLPMPHCGASAQGVRARLDLTYAGQLLPQPGMLIDPAGMVNRIASSEAAPNAPMVEGAL